MQVFIIGIVSFQNVREKRKCRREWNETYCSHVATQFKIDNESFATDAAHERFFITMSAHVTEMNGKPKQIMNIFLSKSLGKQSNGLF